MYVQHIISILSFSLLKALGERLNLKYVEGEFYRQGNNFTGRIRGKEDFLLIWDVKANTDDDYHDNDYDIKVNDNDNNNYNNNKYNKYE